MQAESSDADIGRMEHPAVNLDQHLEPVSAPGPVESVDSPLDGEVEIDHRTIGDYGDPVPSFGIHRPDVGDASSGCPDMPVEPPLEQPGRGPEMPAELVMPHGNAGRAAGMPSRGFTVPRFRVRKYPVGMNRRRGRLYRDAPVSAPVRKRIRTGMPASFSYEYLRSVDAFAVQVEIEACEVAFPPPVEPVDAPADFKTKPDCVSVVREHHPVLALQAGGPDSCKLPALNLDYAAEGAAANLGCSPQVPARVVSPESVTRRIAGVPPRRPAEPSARFQKPGRCRGRSRDQKCKKSDFPGNPFHLRLHLNTRIRFQISRGRPLRQPDSGFLCRWSILRVRFSGKSGFMSSLFSESRKLLNRQFRHEPDCRHRREHPHPRMLVLCDGFIRSDFTTADSSPVGSIHSVKTFCNLSFLRSGGAPC